MFVHILPCKLIRTTNVLFAVKCKFQHLGIFQIFFFVLLHCKYNNYITIPLS